MGAIVKFWKYSVEVFPSLIILIAFSGSSSEIGEKKFRSSMLFLCGFGTVSAYASASFATRSFTF